MLYNKINYEIVNGKINHYLQLKNHYKITTTLFGTIQIRKPGLIPGFLIKRSSPLYRDKHPELHSKFLHPLSLVAERLYGH